MFGRVNKISLTSVCTVVWYTGFNARILIWDWQCSVLSMWSKRTHICLITTVCFCRIPKAHFIVHASNYCLLCWTNIRIMIPRQACILCCLRSSSWCTHACCGIRKDVQEKCACQTTRMLTKCATHSNFTHKHNQEMVVPRKYVCVKRVCIFGRDSSDNSW